MSSCTSLSLKKARNWFTWKPYQRRWEGTVSPSDDHLPVRVVTAVAYVVMAAWLIVAAALRITLQLSEGMPLDPLPFISGGIALLALIALVPAADEFLQRRARDRHRD